MALYFLDSSAIVKRYISESGHTWIVNLCDPIQNHDIQIAQIALVEVVAALCRKAREAAITPAERDGFITDFRSDTVTTYGVRAVTTQIYTYAGDLCRTYRLRAYDAVQLAAASRPHQSGAPGCVPTPTFVCADADLLGHAASEGLSIENPNYYP